MKYFSGLLSILEEQTRCYEKIYQLKEKEQQLVVSGKPEQIQANTEEIDNLTTLIRSLENARLELIDALAQQYGLSLESMNFQQVVDLADEKSSVELEKIAERLVGVLERTSRINEDNAYLIRRSLGVIDRSLEILTGLSAQKDVYGEDGRLESLQTANIAVNRSA